MAKSRKRKLQPPRWIPLPGFVLVAEREDGEGMSVNVVGIPSNPLWTVGAVAGNPSNLLDEHSHKMLGEYPLREALDRAEQFMAEWLANTGPLPERCPCEEIPNPGDVS